MMFPVRITLVYFCEALLLGPLTLGTVRPRLVAAVLKLEPPFQQARWPMLRPVRESLRSVADFAGKLGWIVAGSTASLLVPSVATTGDVGGAAKLGVLLVGVVAAVKLGRGGARFGWAYGRTVAAHPELGINAGPVAATTFGGAVTAVTFTFVVISALLGL